jgi:hypothetical protein
MSCAAAVAVLDCLLTQEVPFAYPDCPQSWVVKQPQRNDLVLMNENRCRALFSCRPRPIPLGDVDGPRDPLPQYSDWRHWAIPCF